MKILGLLRSLGQLLLISIGPGPHFMRKSWGENKFSLLETEQHGKKPSLNFILNMVTLPSEKTAPFIAFRKSAGSPAATDSLQAWKDRLAFKSAAFYLNTADRLICPSCLTLGQDLTFPQVLGSLSFLKLVLGCRIAHLARLGNIRLLHLRTEYSEPVLDRILSS